MTMRRDLEALATTGQVLIVPRGVQAAKGFLAELPYLERIQRMDKEKALIGKAAAALVGEGSSVVLDSGTTTLQVARHLRNKRCTVITMSLTALQELANSQTVRVEMLGGVYRNSSQDLVGPQVYEGLSSVRADRVIFAEFSWTDETNRQAEKRASRKGSDKEFVRCEYIVSPNSMDEVVLQSVFTKQKRVEKVIG